MSCRACVRAFLRAVWLPCGIRIQKRLPTSSLCLLGAPSLPISLLRVTSFPLALPPTPRPFLSNSSWAYRYNMKKSSLWIAFKYLLVNLEHIGFAVQAGSVGLFLPAFLSGGLHVYLDRFSSVDQTRRPWEINGKSCEIMRKS